MADVLVDTDVLVDHLRGTRKLPLRKGDVVAISTVTRCELFSGHDDETVLRRLLESFIEHDVNRAVAERAGRLRRQGRVRTPDALIAATAIEHGCTLVTRNEKDFAGIRGLRLRVPSA